MPQSVDLANKSVDAAVSAIELYNKPHFHHREEAFSLLMTNAWELLLKGKWLLDNHERLESLYEFDSVRDGALTKTPRLNRSGNPITYGLTYLAAKLLEDPNSGLTRPCHANLLALVEIRDNAAHFINKDLSFGRRILEVGTASLQNYLRLVTEWFQIDLSKYNFFLMPLSFYHGFETVSSTSVTPYNEQMRRLLAFLDRLEEDTDDRDEECAFCIRVKTTLVRSKADDAMAFRWTDEKSAPAMTLTEADVLKNYPLTFDDLTKQLRRRYGNFVQNAKFYGLLRELGGINKYCIVRFLDPSNRRSGSKRFYNANIISEFDKHYKKRAKS
jgi:hypothetical protein